MTIPEENVVYRGTRESGDLNQQRHVILQYTSDTEEK
jgi:hypothetical protein